MIKCMEIDYVNYIIGAVNCQYICTKIIDSVLNILFFFLRDYDKIYCENNSFEKREIFYSVDFEKQVHAKSTDALKFGKLTYLHKF